eukprot:11185321-Lingulodinium_polyedra.AAC.1
MLWHVLRTNATQSNTKPTPTHHHHNTNAKPTQHGATFLLWRRFGTALVLVSALLGCNWGANDMFVGCWRRAG